MCDTSCDGGSLGTILLTAGEDAELVWMELSVLTQPLVRFDVIGTIYAVSLTRPTHIYLDLDFVVLDCGYGRNTNTILSQIGLT